MKNNFKEMQSPASISRDARQVANAIIKYARMNKMADEALVLCPDCQLLPSMPVTGSCGHTRCTGCIKHNGPCPCGEHAPQELHVNSEVQYLISKMTSQLPNDGGGGNGDQSLVEKDNLQKIMKCLGTLRRHSQFRATSAHSVRTFVMPAHMPMWSKLRMKHACSLIAVGRLREAVPHLARVAASSAIISHAARTKLLETVAKISKNSDIRRLVRYFYRSIRAQSSRRWLATRDLECVLCYNNYAQPITTPCGHTYCRTCLERSLDYCRACALCQRSLKGFSVMKTEETSFIRAVLHSIDAMRPTSPFLFKENDLPIIVGNTVAYPTIRRQMIILDPHCRLLIRRVMQTDKRRFGLVVPEKDRQYSDVGTILEVQDCKQLEDGRFLLATVGICRFRVVEKGIRDGWCEVARVKRIIDKPPKETNDQMVFVRNLLIEKAMTWMFNKMDVDQRCKLLETYGCFAKKLDESGGYCSTGWYDSCDGPPFVWWLIAALPLHPELQASLLSSTNLYLRMKMVLKMMTYLLDRY